MTGSSPRGPGFVHEAALYAGEDGFLGATAPFVVEGVDAGEPVMVAVGGRKIELLRDALGARAEGVHFVDMGALGANPARIIPAWYDFLDDHGGGHGSVRGIGEPIGPDRRGAVLLECQRHEALLNLAFDGGPAWWLLCPYDTTALPGSVLEEAYRSHPFVSEGGEWRSSAGYRGQAANLSDFDVPLPEPAAPAADVAQLAFGPGPLVPLRRFVAGEAGRRGLGPDRVEDLLVAVNEMATNSVAHGGGSGSVRIWREDGEVVTEVRDGGWIRQPLAGRRRPSDNGLGGRGLWIANQLCDLVQLRSTPAGTVVRLHLAV